MPERDDMDGLNWIAATVTGQAQKRASETMFQLSVDRAELRALIAELFDGLDDYWVTLPEHAAAVAKAKAIYDQTKRN